MSPSRTSTSKDKEAKKGGASRPSSKLLRSPKDKMVRAETYKQK